MALTRELLWVMVVFFRVSITTLKHSGVEFWDTTFKASMRVYYEDIAFMWQVVCHWRINIFLGIKKLYNSSAKHRISLNYLASNCSLAYKVWYVRYNIRLQMKIIMETSYLPRLNDTQGLTRVLRTSDSGFDNYIRPAYQILDVNLTARKGQMHPSLLNSRQIEPVFWEIHLVAI